MYYCTHYIFAQPPHMKTKLFYQTGLLHAKQCQVFFRLLTIACK